MIVMKFLTSGKVKDVYDLEDGNLLFKFSNRVSAYDVKFKDEDKALRAIIKTVNKEFGGRGILNKIEERIIDGLSDCIFENKEDLGVGRTIVINQIKDKAIFDFEVE